MKLSNNKVLLAIAGCLGLDAIGLAGAAGNSGLQFSSEAFLHGELEGRFSEILSRTEAPTSAPSVSNAPTVSSAPTGAPTVSLAPSDNPTESPAPSPSPSETPTSAPTQTAPPTGAPSDNPTESPAPSPSPSEAPSPAPSVSMAPSEGPSLSVAPSAQPSAAPTPVPSAFPSDTPSFAPTISQMPSATPSDSPSDIPSATPSDAPSDAPSVAPSDRPSESPSSTPTAAPSISMSPTTSEPSAAPSGAPTEVSFKTKTGVTSVFLQDLDREMADAALAQFEITTLEFVRDTQTSTPGYTLDLLAVTVLTQDVVYPEPEEDGDTENNASTVGLQVSFRTVGVVTEGVAPQDLDFTTVTDAGFEYYFGEYMHRLSSVDPFFEPLAQHVDTTSLIPVPDRVHPSLEDEGSRKQGQFVAAILFATLALLIAVLATVYSVRKHLRKQEEQKLQQLHTRTMSDDPESPHGAHLVDDEMSDLSATQADPKRCQSERIGTSSNPMQLNIDDEKVEMEDVGLTPLSGYGGAREFFSASKPPRMPVSPNAMERGTSDDDTGTGTFMDLKRSSLGRGIKKWLTPRGSSPKNKSSAIDLSDPMDNEVDKKKTAKSNRMSMEPDAVVASTRNATGVLSNDHTDQEDSQGKDRSTGNTPLGIPARFFGRNSDATSNNMDSMVEGSTASSFFTNMAGRKGSTFTGRNSVTSQSRDDTSGTYKFGSTGGKMDPFSMSDEKLAVLRTNSNDNVEASIAEMSDFDKKRSIFESKPIVNNNTMEDRDDSPVHEREPKRTRTFEADSVYSEQSDMDLNVLGVETTLGALPPKYDSGTPGSRNSGASFVGHQYGSRPTSTTTSKASGKPDFMMRGAKTMAAEEEKRRMSLQAAIQQGDTYDVFAPAGPIGIVVDTSKMGPAVHSLKSTSPMLGLINAGDLIIALDDEDTRNLTAASLTRLMAKKSRQKERKITLLAPEGF